MSVWKNKFKIFVVGGDSHYANWMPGYIVSNLEDANVVVFTGGEDVSPSFYGKTAHPKTYFNVRRDIKEKEIFDKAQKLGKYCVGICRGSQFLCVMSGGELIQHQDNPLYIHNIETYDGLSLPITSTHHQAQYPWVLPKNSFEVIAWTKGISKFHEGEGMVNLPLPDNKECEIVYYKDTKCLGIQGHPESMYLKQGYEKTIDYLTVIFQKFMNDMLQKIELKLEEY